MKRELSPLSVCIGASGTPEHCNPIHRQTDTHTHARTHTLFLLLIFPFYSFCSYTSKCERGQCEDFFVRVWNSTITYTRFFKTRRGMHTNSDTWQWYVDTGIHTAQEGNRQTPLRLSLPPSSSLVQTDVCKLNKNSFSQRPSSTQIEFRIGSEVRMINGIMERIVFIRTHFSDFLYQIIFVFCIVLYPKFLQFIFFTKFFQFICFPKLL